MEHIKNEEQVISILLNDRESVKKWVNSPFDIPYFDDAHIYLLSAIKYANNNDVILTRATYKEFLSEYKKLTPAEVAAQTTIFNRCLMHSMKTEDLPILLEKVKITYIRRKSAQYIRDYSKDRDKIGDIGANRSLAERLMTLDAQIVENKVRFVEIHKNRSEFMKNLMYRRENPSIRLSCGIREVDDTMTKGFETGHLTLFCADVGSYKCLLSSELVSTCDGSYITAKELFERYQRGDKTSILSLNEETQKIYCQDVCGVFDNGIKDVFLIETRCGFTVSVTGNHPVLTFNKWLRADKVVTGNKIAIARKSVFGNKSVGKDLAVWVGCMIADGGTSQVGYRFTNNDVQIISELDTSCKNLGGHIRNSRNIEYSVNGLRKLGIEFGLDKKLAIHKSIVSKIFTWRQQDIRLLLRAMYGCDGSFSVYTRTKNGKTKTRHQVIYCTSSKQLAIDVRNLLLKFGLVGRIFTWMSSYKKKDGTKFKRESYHVYLSDAKQVARFIREIGFLGEKQSKAENCLEAIDRTELKENPNLDLLPSEIWDLVKSKFINGKTEYGCRGFLKGENANRSNCPPLWARRNRGVSRRKIRKIAEYLDNDPELLKICDADIYWDEVISVANIGKHQTYDIAMPTHHNFVANNVITHNTTMMVNIAINLFKKSGVNVMYIPLEMAYEEIMSKIVSRETGIDLFRIEQAEKLTEDEIKRVDAELEKWESMASRFSILKMSERTRVSTIRREIEQRISYFKPRVVFIDYIDNLLPDFSRGNRSDLEINDMIEDMRNMGGALGFSVVSAAQLARDALKRIKEEKDGKHSPLSSTDIRGGQVYTANSDNVYAQLKNPDNPTQLFFSCIKSRFGPTTFRNSASRAILAVKPNIALIESEPDGFTNDFRSKEGQEYVGMIATPPPAVEEEGSPF